jgi:hypothetical protein
MHWLVLTMTFGRENGRFSSDASPRCERVDCVEPAQTGPVCLLMSCSLPRLREHASCSTRLRPVLGLQAVRAPALSAPARPPRPMTEPASIETDPESRESPPVPVAERVSEASHAYWGPRGPLISRRLCVDL